VVASANRLKEWAGIGSLVGKSDFDDQYTIAYLVCLLSGYVVGVALLFSEFRLDVTFEIIRRQTRIKRVCLVGVSFYFLIAPYIADQLGQPSAGSIVSAAFDAIHHSRMMAFLWLGAFFQLTAVSIWGISAYVRYALD